VGQQPLPSNFLILGAVLDIDGRSGHGWAQHVHDDGIIDNVAAQDFAAEDLENLLASVLGQINGPSDDGGWPATIRAWFQPTLF
jgi:hypothetical protein